MILRILKTTSRVLLVLVLLFSSATCFWKVTADEGSSVTATVPDHFPPSTPILISPENESLISTATPDFQWYESSDDVGLSHYQIYLDGKQVWGDLPLTSSQNNYYQLNYDPINGIYSLIPKSILADAQHSWKIVAYDFADNFASSDTWTFTIDTLAPNFIVRQIGDKNTNISSQNPDSVPIDPILLFVNDPYANEPLIKAVSEAGAMVHLRVSIPGDPDQHFDGVVNNDGTYELKLGILPRDVNIRLDFTITDAVGHVSVIEALYIRIPIYYWPPAPTPTATTTISPSPSLTITPSPSPATGAATLSPTPTIHPSVSPTPGGIQIPIIPPREIIHELTQEGAERLPKGLAAAIDQFSRSRFWLSISGISALILTLLPLLLTFLFLLGKYWHELSLPLVGKVGRFVFTFPFIKRQKKNIVFEYSQMEVAPFVKVALCLAETDEVLDYTFTDHLGYFPDFRWPKEQMLKLRVFDRNFYYPIGVKKPVQLEFHQFYQDEKFQVMRENSEPFFIPTLISQGQREISFLDRLRAFSIYLLTYPWFFFTIFFLFSLLITLRYPTLWNASSLLLYFFVIGRKLRERAKKEKIDLAVSLSGGQKFSGNVFFAFISNSSQESSIQVLPIRASQQKSIDLFAGEYQLTLFAKDRVYSYQKHAVGREIFTVNSSEKEDKTHQTASFSLQYIEKRQNTLAYLQPLSLLRKSEQAEEENFVQ